MRGVVSGRRTRTSDGSRTPVTSEATSGSGAGHGETGHEADAEQQPLDLAGGLLHAAESGPALVGIGIVLVFVVLVILAVISIQRAPQ